MRSRNELNERLFEAAERGDAAAVKALLEAGANVNAADNFGWTALMEAAHEGHADVLQALLEAGADVNVKSRDGETALIAAARVGHTETAQALIAAGAALDAADNFGWTALMKAAMHGHVEAVRALLAAGANVNAAVVNAAVVNAAVVTDYVSYNAGWMDAGCTALMYAAKFGHVEVVRELLAAGADVNAAGEEGRRRLFPDGAAVRRLLVSLLVTALWEVLFVWGAVHYKQRAVESGGWWPFLLASLFALLAVWVAWSVISAVPFVAGCIAGETALMKAAEKKHEEVMRALIAGGAHAVWDAAALRLRGEKAEAAAIIAARKRAGRG